MAGYTPTRAFTPEQRAEMNRATAGLPTKSAKIRALAAAGYSRAEIAAFLGTSYQHVRSVLGPAGAAEKSDVAPAPAADNDDESPQTWGAVQVGEQGELRLPDHVLVLLRADPGHYIGWRLDDEGVVLMNRKSGVRFIQEMAQQYVVEGEELWSDQLIRERREEAAREDEEDRKSG